MVTDVFEVSSLSLFEGAYGTLFLDPFRRSRRHSRAVSTLQGGNTLLRVDFTSLSPTLKYLLEDWKRNG
jgi:hypothetical protein